MKKILLSFILIACALWSAAKSYNPDNLPALDNTTRVANPDGILSTASIDSINTLLLTFDKHNVQCLVAVVERIDNDDPYDFAIRLGRRFGVGGKSSQGVVIVLATLDRSYQIVTGSGMEKYLPDAICKRIEMQALVPHLKDGDWNGGMVATVKMMCRYLEKDPELMAQSRKEQEEDQEFIIAFAVLFFATTLIFIGVAVCQSYRKRRCPKCGKHHFVVTKREKIRDKQGNTHIFTTRTCRECLYRATQEKVIKKEEDDDGGGIFFIGGGGGGHHSSFGGGGGGFSGFGGGTFSGGGAGGRF